MIHICFVITGDIKNWPTAKRATGMTEPLFNLGAKVSIIALDCINNRKRFAYECPNANIHYHKPCSVKKEVKFKKKVIEEIKPDLVYINALGLRTWIHKYNCNSPKSIFVVEHSELFSAIPSAKIYKRILAFFYEKVSKYIFDGQVAASRYLENYLKKNIHSNMRKKVLYLPYAFNESILQGNMESLKNLQTKYNSNKVIIYMGTLIINYGFLDLIKAVKIVEKELNESIKILIMGEGRHKKIAESLVAENNLLNTIELLGYVEEDMVGNYFKIADAFVSPLFNTVQDWARCPSKLYMYLPFNKPVITNMVGEAIELFKGEDFFYESGNVNEFAQCIKKAILCENYNRNVEIKQHNWNDRAEKLIDWYNSSLIK